MTWILLHLLPKKTPTFLRHDLNQSLFLLIFSDLKFHNAELWVERCPQDGTDLCLSCQSPWSPGLPLIFNPHPLRNPWTLPPPLQLSQAHSSRYSSPPHSRDPPAVPNSLPRSTHHILPLTSAAHMQAKKRYLLVSVAAGLIFLVYLWALQVGEFAQQQQQQQKPYQYPQYPHYPQFHQHEYQLYHHSQGVYQHLPLPQRRPPRPSRHWAEPTQPLEPYLEGGEQEVSGR